MKISSFLGGEIAEWRHLDRYRSLSSRRSAGQQNVKDIAKARYCVHKESWWEIVFFIGLSLRAQFPVRFRYTANPHLNYPNYSVLYQTCEAFIALFLVFASASSLNPSY